MHRLLRQIALSINKLHADRPLTGASDLSEQIVGYPISALTLRDIPTSPTGLPSGSVWSDGGTLKIVSLKCISMEFRRALVSSNSSRLCSSLNWAIIRVLLV
jgi:hypothetical protein